MNQSFHAHDERSDRNPDSCTEYRIREDREAIHPNQDGAVTDPGCLQPFSGPSCHTREARQRLDGTPSILGHAPPENRRGVKRKSS
jgi:hypothetical protein